ncbi:disulfide bond formation protein B [Bordetella genomosp. 4]|uniref:Disulfide bond formation protein B n=1 Tax=Bordetella genomosp. 4 TaxID=463044 RepID=A0A261U6D0_9BORD|nr:disulfide bond formation protein B [Bordetella genomosp. 4]OZI56952.1 disulfide bond formation protein B [Bordetella genomosp. 4]
MQSSRRLLWLIAILCFGALGVALVSQHVYDMPPCAWCVLQRLIYLTIGVIALIGANVRVLARLCAGLAALLSVGGIAAAWYQYDVAAHMFSCDQTFADQFMSASGLDGAVPWLFGIYASCMDAMVEVLGVEYALWSLSLFVLLLLASLWGMLRR